MIEMDNLVKHEVTKINRARSDLQMELEKHEQKLKEANVKIEGVNKVIEKSALITSCLVEQAYVESLLIFSGEDTKKIKYRDQYYNRDALIQLKVDMLNETWNPLFLEYPWKDSHITLIQKSEPPILTTQTYKRPLRTVKKIFTETMIPSIVRKNTLGDPILTEDKSRIHKRRINRSSGNY